MKVRDPKWKKKTAGLKSEFIEYARNPSTGYWEWWWHIKTTVIVGPSFCGWCETYASARAEIDRRVKEGK